MLPLRLSNKMNKADGNNNNNNGTGKGDEASGYYGIGKGDEASGYYGIGKGDEASGSGTAGKEGKSGGSASTLSLTLKSERPSRSCKSLPYNGSASYYNNCPPPLSEADYRGRPQPVFLPEARRSQRPLSRQLFDRKFGKFLAVPNYAAVPNVQVTLPPHVQALPVRRRADPNQLSEVITEIKPGPDIPFYVERKRESPPNPYKKLFAQLMFAAIFLYLIYRYTGLIPSPLRAENSPLGNVAAKDVAASGPGPAGVADQTPMADSINGKSVDITPCDDPSKVLKMPSAADGDMRVVFSVDDDVESTVETLI